MLQFYVLNFMEIFMSNISITTYIDNEKLLCEKVNGTYVESDTIYEITYTDKNSSLIKVLIDKDFKYFSIVKDGVKTSLKQKREKSHYQTPYGLIYIETALISIDKQEKGSFIAFNLDYQIYFSTTDSQVNQLKIVIKK